MGASGGLRATHVALLLSASVALLWASVFPYPPVSPAETSPPSVVVLPDGVVATGTGSARIEVPPASAGIATLQITFDCLTSGVFAWGGSADSIEVSACSGTDAADAGSARTRELPIADVGELTVETATWSGWSVVARFVGERPAPSGVNLSGQTYGVIGENGEAPDLVGVVGLDQEGRQVRGFVFWSEVASKPATSPQESVTRRARDRATYPNGKEIAIYEADGKTRVGTFTVGVG